MKFARVLPAGMVAYWRPQYGQRLRTGLPVLKNKRNGGLRMGIGIARYSTSVSGTRPENLAPWYVEWTGGDSGSAVGPVVNDEYVFLGNAWTGPGNNDDGTSYISSSQDRLDAANTALSAWGHSLTYVDLSGIASYE